MTPRRAAARGSWALLPLPQSHAYTPGVPPRRRCAAVLSARRAHRRRGPPIRSPVRVPAERAARPFAAFLRLRANHFPHLIARSWSVQNADHSPNTQTRQEPQKAVAVTIRHNCLLNFSIYRMVAPGYVKDNSAPALVASAELSECICVSKGCSAPQQTNACARAAKADNEAFSGGTFVRPQISPARLPGFRRREEREFEKPSAPKRENTFGPRPLNMPGTRTVSRCAECGALLQNLSDPVGQCPKCHFDLHSCKQCEHFDPSSRFECNQPIPARISPKDKRNDCSLYSIRVMIEKETSSKGSARPNDARAAFDNLFKD